MGWILGSVAGLIVAVVIWFQISYSPTRRHFQRDVQRHAEQSPGYAGVFTEADIAHLPAPVQNHFRVAGLIGQAIMPRTEIVVPSAHIFESKDRMPLVMDYTFCLFGHKPVRLAYMHTSMFGFPFEAFDSFQDGKGFMKGVIGKVFPLFHEMGPTMNRSQLMTILGELFFIPSLILSDYITWESIDAHHVRATIRYGDVSGSGIFTFGDDGFISSFRTKDRARIDTDGSVASLEWSGVFDGWTTGENGMWIPINFKAIWHEPDGDFIYFEPTKGFVFET